MSFLRTRDLGEIHPREYALPSRFWAGANFWSPGVSGGYRETGKIVASELDAVRHAQWPETRARTLAEGKG